MRLRMGWGPIISSSPLLGWALLTGSDAGAHLYSSSVPFPRALHDARAKPSHIPTIPSGVGGRCLPVL